MIEMPSWIAAQNMLKLKLPAITPKKSIHKVWSLDDFEIGRLLGEGSFGRVYRAIEKTSNMVVAIKEMYIEKIIQDNMEEQLGREVGKAPFTDKDVERTYEKIELVNYRIPKQFSSEVRDLIRSLLKSNPEKIQKICSNCGLPNILTQDNKCADCNTYAEVKLTSGCRITEFDVVVSSKRTKIAQGGVLPNIHQNLLPKKSKKGAKWTVNIEHATLEGFKNSIRAINQTSALENDGAVLNMLNDSGKYSPKNDQALYWSFLKVCQLYGLGKSDDPSLSVFPPFTCECKDLKDEPSQVLLKNLIVKLKAHLKTIPINGNEASKSQYVCLYLVAGYYSLEGVRKTEIQIIKPDIVVYDSEDMESMVERVLGHIA
ncbi:AUR protein kinase [Rhizophagus irregularis DAOM 181602=DAOM 197198]|nr:AUR protein kinase [Rhizophagus irregularis DAOM 181602=DAOM 197198]